MFWRTSNPAMATNAIQLGENCAYQSMNDHFERIGCHSHSCICEHFKEVDLVEALLLNERPCTRTEVEQAASALGSCCEGPAVIPCPLFIQDYPSTGRVDATVTITELPKFSNSAAKLSLANTLGISLGVGVGFPLFVVIFFFLFLLRKRHKEKKEQEAIRAAGIVATQPRGNRSRVSQPEQPPPYSRRATTCARPVTPHENHFELTELGRVLETPRQNLTDAQRRLSNSSLRSGSGRPKGARRR